MAVEVPLTQGYVALIDDEDADLADFKWHVFINRHGPIYAKRWSGIYQPRRILLLMHRIVLGRVVGWELNTEEQVDHIDGNGLNNQRCNLRLVTALENARNARRRKDNKSGFKGVYWKNGRGHKNWIAHIRINGVQTVLGTFYTPEEAHEMYCQAAQEIHGEYARFE